ncbi:MAG TPA: GTPase ObgE [Candidatus Saccharimonadales bacterium]|jgi:GTP-binding protein
MFVDSAKLVVAAGRGGDGRVSFRTEKFVTRGGPDGGDGGRGGDVIFVADNNTSTLADFRVTRTISAENGQPGDKRRKHGRNAEDRIVKVPVGTIIYRDNAIVADLTEPGQRAIVAKGGDGGFGNAHFKSSTRQAPRVAELGEKGDTFEARLELKLIADVGLVGFPNAGKSTFLSVVTGAKPEIADYAFTTLTPNLGVADIDESGLLIADIPGLIEGASQGKGLGDAFLRHIERTAVILHLIDAYTDDPAASYQTIRKELQAYSQVLGELPEVVVLSKTDGLDDEIVQAQMDELKAVVPATTSLMSMSAQARQGTTEVLRTLAKRVSEVRQRQAAEAEDADAPNDDEKLITLTDTQLSDVWHVTKIEDFFVITGPKIERFAARTDFSNPHSVNRLRDIMHKLGIAHELRRAGATGDTMITFGSVGQPTISFQEQ